MPTILCYHDNLETKQGTGIGRDIAQEQANVIWWHLYHNTASLVFSTFIQNILDECDLDDEDTQKVKDGVYKAAKVGYTIAHHAEIKSSRLAQFVKETKRLYATMFKEDLDYQRLQDIFKEVNNG